MGIDYRFGTFELRTDARELLSNGQPIAIGGRAFNVLVALIERPNRLVTKDDLLDIAWPGLVVEENNLQVQISTLRKILGDGIIKTVPGRGYIFTAPLGPLLADARNNLPRPLTRFIGHEADLDLYRRMIGHHRLVTLIGAGGCGKTRFAIELTSRVLPSFENGAWFVDLAPLDDAERLPFAVARGFDLHERSGRAMTDVVCEHIAGQHLLIVLDNCEHLLGACADLTATLLGRAPHAHVLATSREALGVPGERTLRVRSLACPPAEPGPTPRFQDFEAVQLFVDRASLVQPEFSLDATTGPAVAEICRRLDGIPLAIELAAARMKVCSIAELQSLMHDRFKLLVGGSKSAPPRQQTLLATIEWSFGLLSEDERRLMHRLSVFSGGWTLEAAHAVAAESAGPYELLDVLTHLVDSSLITSHRRNGNRTRYSMLETVREYCRTPLADSGEKPAIARRHLQYFAELAERLGPAIRNENSEGIEQLAPELENILQALGNAADMPEDEQLALRIVANLDQYWLALGALELGYRVTSNALSRRRAADASRARARALYAAERLAFFLNRNDEARAWGDACVELARSLQDDGTTARALGQLAYIAIEAGAVDDGIGLYRQLLEIAHASADEEQIGRALTGLGIAQEYLGNPRAALPFYDEALERARVRSDARGLAICATNVAEAYIKLGRVADAWPVVLEAVDVASRTMSHWTMQVALDLIVTLSSAVQEWRVAARMLGATDAALRRGGHKRQRDAAFQESVASVVRNALPPSEFDAEHDAGFALTLEHAFDEAREWLATSEARDRRPVSLDATRSSPTTITG